MPRGNRRVDALDHYHEPTKRFPGPRTISVRSSGPIDSGKELRNVGVHVSLLWWNEVIICSELRTSRWWLPRRTYNLFFQTRDFEVCYFKSPFLGSDTRLVFPIEFPLVLVLLLRMCSNGEFFGSMKKSHSSRHSFF